MRFSIADSIASRCIAHPERDAMLTIGTEEKLSYSDVWRRITALATAVSACKPGRHGKLAALLLPNGPDAALAIAACQRAGVVAVPINGRLTRPEMQHILSDADCGLLLTGGMYTEAATDLGAGLGIELARAENIPTAREFVRPALGEEEIGDWPSVVGYTSGTTGSPKGAIYSHDYYSMNNYRWGWQFGLTADHTVLISGPMFHISYAGFALAALSIGANIRIMSEFSARIALDELQHDSTFCFLVPSMLAMIVEEWHHRGRPPVNKARYILTAGAPVRQSLLLTAMDMFANAKVSEMYGWTEGAFVSFETKDRETLVDTCVGWPALDADVALFDDVGELCAEGEAGEVGVRSGVRFAGYLGGEDLAPAVNRHGYVLSGDIGRWLPDGRLCIIDRKKDVIISGGENVYTAEVEQVLLAHEGIEEVAVVGLPDDKWGERVAALVVPKKNGQLDPAGIIAFCRDRIAGYKIPRTIEFAAELPRNSMGKVQKFKVADELQARTSS